MNDKLSRAYNPAETESRIYKLWEESGFFNPDNLPDRNGKQFTVIMPPPNATGTLHLGHALEHSLQDAVVRYHRMRGDETLWLPGTDHAAIATNTKVEKILSKEEGKNRHDIGREAFVKKVEDFVSESRGTMQEQIRQMGDSVDWSREAFTMDEERNLAVRTAFKRMYDAGLIYKGDRIVNWDPKGQTTISDDEVVYVQEKTKFYYLKYGPFIIGTARPETKFADKYVVMHPDDPRYASYEHGQKFTVEWINGPIEATVIKDESIDPEFGTGVMTITPWHSVTDFDLAQKYDLKYEQIINQYGKLLPVAGEFAGMKIKDAREKIIEKLQEKGLVEKVEDYTHNIATAERSGGIIEPQIMKQWFVSVNNKFKLQNSKIKGIESGQETTLKEIMTAVVKNGQVQIMPERFERVYFHWIDNLRDWNISRQLWYGHRIPVWYKGEEVRVEIEAPKEEGFIQDEDTLDTWFSSALWTFSTLGWPNEGAKDLLKFHPTSFMNPGYEILFFWVARMILMSGFLLGEIPFDTVYLHGMLRDSQGRKFSKSLDNGIDPIDVINQYGADALRMSVLVGIGPGNDGNFDLNKVKAYKNFANKIWNISRFVIENTEKVDEGDIVLSEDDKEALSSFEAMAKEVTSDIEKYHLYLATEKIYHYVWHTFADIIIEKNKDRIYKGEDSEKKAASYVLRQILEGSLKLLHPFMPFVTEEIWQIMGKDKLLMIESWPVTK